jgi:hypothetical protein
MAVGDFLSKPAGAAGVGAPTAAVAWNAGAYQDIATASDFSNSIAILGVTFQRSEYAIAGADTTREYLLEIATGTAGSEVVQLQIPWTVRMDTAAEHNLSTAVTYFLPEPFVVPALTRIAVHARIGTNDTVTVAGIKILYYEIAAGAPGPAFPHGHRSMRALQRR